MANESGNTNRYLWAAGAVGTGACVAYLLSRKDDRWTTAKKSCVNMAKATKKQMGPWMRSATDTANEGARYMKDTLASSGKKISEAAPEIKTGAAEFLDAMSELWTHGRKLARSVQR
jgi:hypothetical protein